MTFTADQLRERAAMEQRLMPHDRQIISMLEFAAQLVERQERIDKNLAALFVVAPNLDASDDPPKESQ